MKALALLVLLAAACQSTSGPDRTCACKPASDPARYPAAKLLADLRKHVRQVRDHANARDVKLTDDEIRLHAATACAPCQFWIDDRAAVDELYPLDHLDDAVDATCLGLRDARGTVHRGRAYPACQSSP